MAQPISLRDLEQKFLDLDIPEQELADYVEIRPERSRPFAPALAPRADSVDLQPPLGGPAIRAELLGDVVNRLAKERRRRQFERDLSRRPALPTIYAEGDSWFQFPVFIEELIDHLGAQFNIHCTSTAGDTLQNMLFDRPEYLTELKRLIFLRGLDVRGFFFSGAGNDVIGEGKDGVPALETLVRPFDAAQTPAWHLDTPECRERLEFIESAYRRLFDSVEEVFSVLAYPRLKIYVHGYDYVQVRSLPDGDPHRPVWARDWTGGPLRAKGFTDNAFGSAVLRELLDRLNSLTERVCAAYARGVYVNLRGSILPSQWADELHATSQGYKAAASRFLSHVL
ncbi:hypothetical protein [Cyanobium sp. CH-040]|uniref:hypothetical protein n=1 Tax=Cyanobium sp. CH-040 TaxID=2823708 RepID=UPI0020CB6BAB|nr:hypothetical protein [Cyanobium sp. CH-040]MCP9927680.1 hypothetical protein [Cyanobium sp. CH-040]